MGWDLTMPSIVGMASLFGVVGNDSILLVTFISEERRRGMGTIDTAKSEAQIECRAGKRGGVVITLFDQLTAMVLQA